MFDGLPADQFHQFIASSRAPLPLIPLPFSLHHHNHVPSSAPAAFSGDLYPSHQMLPQMHHHSPPPTDIGKSGGESAPAAVPWSNEEVLTLLRIRSSMENWYTWEHVSRKLGDHGYQRSADKCKEKFEEESRHFNTSMGYNNKNFRFFSDLEELYHHDIDISKGTQDLGKEGAPHHDDHQEQEMNANVVTETTATNPSSSNQDALVAEETEAGSGKRKREHKFEMLKGFCEAVVKKVVAQQEDLHNKLIQDMVKRDEESIAREQAWKCQEMERINKEIETRAREQVIAWERQAKIIDLLKSFTASSSSVGAGNGEEDQYLMAKIDEFFKVRKATASAACVTSSSEIFPPASSISNLSHHHNPTSSSTTEATPSPQNQYYSSLKTSGQSPSKKPPFSPPPPSSAQKEDQSRCQDQNKLVRGGKRWPREEVQALINLKCQISNSGNGGDENSKECAGSKCPLWERISQGMMELGYNRSAKRCKEKWENINKYFRKTKDSKKKRSLESRTCPYFHQLSTLYTQGTLALPAPSDLPPADQPPDHSR